ncbi:MAG: glycosyltransferase family 2 protein [Anaerolineae bacterium]|jgi:glycosyltransferase involved in cell wall biosynthesis
MKKISVIVPVYNEAETVGRVVKRVQAVEIQGYEQEIVVVNDGSTDGTYDVLERIASRWPESVIVVHHEQNRGKGAAIRTALGHVTGEIVITQDADLEYDPEEYPRLLALFEDPAVQVVYGSRNLRDNPRSSWRYYWGGRLVSWVANLLYGSDLTDEATGYKLFRTELLRSLDLRADGFEFCPEVTGKVLGRGIRIYEIPISYQPRSFEEGKKIGWRDGVKAVWTLLKHRLGWDSAVSIDSPVCGE